MKKKLLDLSGKIDNAFIEVFETVFGSLPRNLNIVVDLDKVTALAAVDKQNYGDFVYL